ncbi:MAG: hypothetical protein KME64_00670 [Scytonematopsis contorta HA4267-MV1]|jgi:hypothetical protein|nr:hypothetical protein [Scytonematopsis contorta HA4267-MV1]
MKRGLIAASLAAITLVATSTIGASAFANNKQNLSYKNFCPSGEESTPTKATIAAETKGFYVNICQGKGENKALYYVGSAKKGNGYIFLPLSRSQKGSYSAVNNNYTYTLNLNTKSLRVHKGGKLVLQETVYNIKYI